jgi:hypothetical protein
MTPKTITTRAGEQFTLDFYCSRRAAHMTFIGCDRMRAAAKNGPVTKHSGTLTAAPIVENPCLNCPQGKDIEARNHARRKPGRRSRDHSGKPATCLWPDCTDPAWASGLCQNHSRQLKRNALIKVNTADAGPTAVAEFLTKLLQMANDAHMPLEDVALAAMDEGVNIYFERKRRKKQNGPV